MPADRHIFFHRFCTGFLLVSRCKKVEVLIKPCYSLTLAYLQDCFSPIQLDQKKQLVVPHSGKFTGLKTLFFLSWAGSVECHPVVV